MHEKYRIIRTQYKIGIRQIEPLKMMLIKSLVIFGIVSNSLRSRISKIHQKRMVPEMPEKQVSSLFSSTILDFDLLWSSCFKVTIESAKNNLIQTASKRNQLN